MPGVIDRDRGYASLKRELEKLARQAHPRVYVGILQDKGAETYDTWRWSPKKKKRVKVEGSLTLAGYAAANEFGTDNGHVPERSFLRSTVADHTREYADEIEEAVGDFIDAAIKSPGSGSAVLKRGLGRLGLRVTRDVQQKIRDIHDPPNAPATLEKKYPGQNPLIHTGRMRQSIAHLVEMGTAAESAASGAAK